MLAKILETSQFLNIQAELFKISNSDSVGVNRRIQLGFYFFYEDGIDLDSDD